MIYHKNNMDKEEINLIFSNFVNLKSISDIHVRPNERLVSRDNGELKYFSDEILKTSDVLSFIQYLFIIRYKYKAESEYKDFIKNKFELDLAINIPNSNFRARINIFKTLGNYGIVIRKIPDEIPELNDLGFSDLHIRKMKEYTGLKEGLILITGQTGSGKTTTLAAIINYINLNKKKHIITIEDPVEFKHKSKSSMITHREVGPESDTNSFADGVRASLREDPDIILVGEMRDKETAEAALKAATTGHLVFATLHTNSAAETLIRVLDMFDSTEANSVKVSLSASIRMIISQKLAPTLEGERALMYEFLYVNPGIRQAILKEKGSFAGDIVSQMEQKYREGMQTMNRCLYSFYKKGKISLKVAEEYSSDKENLKHLLEDD